MHILILPAVAIFLAASFGEHDHGFGNLAEICLQDSLERTPDISPPALEDELSQCLNTPEAMEAFEIERDLPGCKAWGRPSQAAHCLVGP